MNKSSEKQSPSRKQEISKRLSDALSAPGHVIEVVGPVDAGFQPVAGKALEAKDTNLYSLAVLDKIELAIFGPVPQEGNGTPPVPDPVFLDGVLSCTVHSSGLIYSRLQRLLEHLTGERGDS